MAALSTLTDPSHRHSSVAASKTVLQGRVKRFKELIRELRKQRRQLRAGLKLLQRQVKQLQMQLADAQRSNACERSEAARPTEGPRWIKERPLPGHLFGASLIALSIELAKRVGFRGTAFVLDRMFEFCDIEQKVPSHDVIEQWTLRLGVAELGDTFTKDQDVLWFVDHSSQIGKEKVLLIIGVALADLPPPGETLSFEKMKVLAIVPGQHWKRQDVQREYERLAEQIGAPTYLLCDGAVELREPAEILEKNGQKTIVLGDLKHHAANLLEKLIARDEQFADFYREVNLTRNRVQQTELSHFAPPTLKQKSRFMNLGALLNWAAMTLHHLEDLASLSRLGINPQRMEEKFGWLRCYASALSQWRECQEVIDGSLKVINCQGLSLESVKILEETLRPWLCRPLTGECPSCRLAAQLIDFVRASQAKLPDGQRAWLSTEVLESLFGKFKQLEGQHSRGGFTRLIAALPTLCRRVDASLVRRHFTKVKANDLKQWLRKTLGDTLTARRNRAYREYRQATPSHP